MCSPTAGSSRQNRSRRPNGLKKPWSRLFPFMGSGCSPTVGNDRRRSPTIKPLPARSGNTGSTCFNSTSRIVPRVHPKAQHRGCIRTGSSWKQGSRFRAGRQFTASWPSTRAIALVSRISAHSIAGRNAARFRLMPISRAGNGVVRKSGRVEHCRLVWNNCLDSPERGEIRARDVNQRPDFQSRSGSKTLISPRHSEKIPHISIGDLYWPAQVVEATRQAKTNLFACCKRLLPA